MGVGISIGICPQKLSNPIHGAVESRHFVTEMFI